MAGIPSSYMAQDLSLEKDCRLVAEAAIAGADVSVTRDLIATHHGVESWCGLRDDLLQVEPIPVGERIS